MSLKRKLTKAEYDALPEALKAHYKAVGDSFELEAEGFEDPAELRRAKDREVENARIARERAEAAERELNTLKDTRARKDGDIATLEASWRQKHADAEKVGRETAEKLTRQLQTVLVDKEAATLAAELGGDNAILLLPHIKTRLQAELDGETAITRVLDKDGKKSAMSITDLKKEISEDKLFSSVVVQSRASGGGAAGGNRSSSGAGSGRNGKKFQELTGPERVEWNKTDPEGFKKASEAFQLEQRNARMKPVTRSM